MPDSAVKGPWPEAETLSDVVQEKVSFDLSIESDL